MFSKKQNHGGLKMKSIKTKFALILGVIVLFVCGGLVITSYVNATEAITTVAEDFMVQMVKESSKVIDKEIRYQHGVMVTLANSETIRDMTITNVDKLEYLKEVVEREGYTSFGIGDTSGNVTVIGGAVIDLSQRDYYQQALQGHMTVTDPIISKEDGKLLVNYAVPIKDKSQTVIGVLIGARSGDELSNMTNNIHLAATGKAYMLNSAGTTVAHYEQDRVINMENIFTLAKDDSKFQKLADITRNIIKGETGFGEYTFNSEDKYVAYAPVENTGWFLALSVPQNEILSTLDSLKQSIITVSVVFFLIGIVLIYIIAGYITKKIKSITSQLNTLSKGDFSQTVDLKKNKNTDEIGEAHRSLQIMQVSISGMINAIQQTSQEISNHADHLSTVSDQMSSASEHISFSIQETGKGITSQAEGLTDINETLSSFGEKIDHIVKNIKEVDENTTGISSLSTKGNENMEQLIDSVSVVNNAFSEFKTKIEGLNQNISQVTDITTVINGIAEQTNLLSLNAAIEAARAGESGKGFAVVATEIRKLAEQSQHSSQTIDHLINSISGDATLIINTTGELNVELEKQINIINSTIDSYRNIISELSAITSKIQVVNLAANEINKDKVQILDRVSDASSVSEEVAASSEEISSATQELAASTEEVAQSALSLNSMTKDMLTQVSKFKIS